jgi:hypothetical protein
LSRVYAGRYELSRFDVGTKSNYLHLVYWQETLKKESNESVCMVVNGRHMLDGLGSIRKDLLPRMPEYLREIQAGKVGVVTAPSSTSPPKQADAGAIDRRARNFTLAAVAVAGFVDGINPCAISTLVFFMSLLAVSKVRGGGLLLMGASFCLASFATYTALGFGLLRAMHLFTGFPLVRLVVETTMMGFLGVLAFLSFRDAYRYATTRDAGQVTLQLPESMKQRIHGIMRSGLGLGSLAAAGLAIGTAVTALESVCTGQVYVPTLTLVIKSNPTALRSWSYLLLYNGMFIVPLAAVFVLTFFGLRTQALLAWSRKNVVPSKVLLGCLFVAMTLLIGWL